MLGSSICNQGLCLYTIGCILIFSQCHQNVSETQDNGILLAMVDNVALYDGDIKHLIHPNTSQQDSISLVTAYIDQWIRDQLIVEEASRYFSSDQEIDRLVKNYRAKLLKFNLEEKIFQERYDTIISQLELATFYDQIKEQFTLEEELYRCFYVKIEKDKQGIKDFRSNWNRDKDMTSIKSYAAAFATEYHMDTTVWISWSEMNSWFDNWSKGRIKQHNKQRQNDSDYEYFLKIVDSIDKGDISPLEYIKPQLYHMFLYQRKQDIIEDYKQELYERALSSNKLKIKK